MTKTKESIIFWFVALSVIFGVIFGPRIYLNYRIEQKMKKAIIVPIFQAGAIAQAKALYVENSSDRELVDKYYLLFITEAQTRKDLLNRIRRNKKLANALQHAKEQGVMVVFSSFYNDFRISSGSVDIPPEASDEEIITFLLGSSAKDQASQ